MQSDDVGEKQVYPLLAIPEQITEGRSSGLEDAATRLPWTLISDMTSGRGQWGGFPMEVDALLDTDSAS